MGQASEIKNLADAVERVKRDLQGVRAHVPTPESRDYVYTKIASAERELEAISSKLRKIALE